MTTPSNAEVKPGVFDNARLAPLPDPPRKNDMRQTENFELRAVMNTVARFFGALHDDSDVLVSGNGYVCASRSQLPHAPYPDMVIAFGVDRASLINNNGYEIDRAGKPPDFVLEVASEHTGRRDYTTKRDDYARLGIPEYWRFDYTGGRFHDAALAGDRLVNGAYQRIEVTPGVEGGFWGYSRRSGTLSVLGQWPAAFLQLANAGLPARSHRTGGRPGCRKNSPTCLPKPASANWKSNCNSGPRE